MGAKGSASSLGTGEVPNANQSFITVRFTRSVRCPTDGPWRLPSRRRAAMARVSYFAETYVLKKFDHPLVKEREAHLMLVIAHHVPRGHTISRPLERRKVARMMHVDQRTLERAEKLLTKTIGE